MSAVSKQCDEIIVPRIDVARRLFLFACFVVALRVDCQMKSKCFKVQHISRGHLLKVTQNRQRAANQQSNC